MKGRLMSEGGCEGGGSKKENESKKEKEKGRMEKAGLAKGVFLQPAYSSHFTAEYKSLGRSFADFQLPSLPRRLVCLRPSEVSYH